MARPSKSEASRQTQQTLDEAGVHAAKLIRDVLRGRTLVTTTTIVDGKPVTKTKLTKMPRVAASKLVAAKIAIEQAIGLPKAKLYIKTDALTMQDIAELAQTFGESDGESGDVLLIPAKPLTKRQMAERAKN